MKTVTNKLPSVYMFRYLSDHFYEDEEGQPFNSCSQAVRLTESAQRVGSGVSFSISQPITDTLVAIGMEVMHD